MSVDRPGGRPAASAVDRAVDCDGLCMLVHIGRPLGQPVSAAAVSSLPWLPHRRLLRLPLSSYILYVLLQLPRVMFHIFLVMCYKTIVLRFTC